MYQSDFKKYLNSKEYRSIEYDPIYKKIRKILTSNLNKNIFLEVEELLHAELIFKIESAFRSGYNCSAK